MKQQLILHEQQQQQQQQQQDFLPVIQESSEQQPEKQQWHHHKIPSPTSEADCDESTLSDPDFDRFQSDDAPPHEKHRVRFQQQQQQQQQHGSHRHRRNQSFPSRIRPHHQNSPQAFQEAERSQLSFLKEMHRSEVSKLSVEMAALALASQEKDMLLGKLTDALRAERAQGARLLSDKRCRWLLPTSSGSQPLPA